MYNKYSYTSDVYLIPKTCTRTCLFLEYPGVMARSFLKIDIGSGLGCLPRARQQSRSVTRLYVTRVYRARRDAGGTRLNTDERPRGFPRRFSVRRDALISDLSYTQITFF